VLRVHVDFKLADGAETLFDDIGAIGNSLRQVPILFCEQSGLRYFLASSTFCLAESG
jgi:hypothetical protein